MIANNIELTPDHFGQKWTILGMSGSGKSHTARVVIEEGLKQGVTFTIIDPQEAYLNLENFHYIHAIKVKRARDMGILLASTNRNTVINTKRMTIKEQENWLKNFLEGYRLYIRKGIRTIIIDEMHKFAPEQHGAESKEEVRSMFQENRSDGLGCIAVEQRSQRLDKTVLSQSNFLIIHKLDSHKDVEVVRNYLSDPRDGDKIRKLKIGEALFRGFSDEPIIAQVRKAETEHSGSAPKNLLTEDTENFNRYINKLHGGKKMPEADLVKNVVPSMDTYLDLVGKGVKMSLGLGAAGFVGAFVASKVKSPIPYVSSRTLASGVTSIALYTGYRMAQKKKMTKVADVLGYATAGAAVHTAGSLVFDILAATKIKVPNFVNFGLVTMTGVPPIYAEGMTAAEPGKAEVDLNTGFAE